MILINRHSYLFFSLMIISINCYSQSQNYSIDFDNGLQTDLAHYQVQIKRDSDLARIFFKKTVKVSYKKLNKDKQYKILMDSVISHHVDNPELILNEIEKIQSKYIRSSNDEITVSLQDYPDYFALIDSIYFCDSEILLNKLKNKNRLVLDGTTLHMTVISESKEEKNLYFHSPTVDLHPIIIKVINDTFWIYSEKTGKEFLESNSN